MLTIFKVKSIRAMLLALIAMSLMTVTSSFAADSHTTLAFTGVKANTGTATHYKEGNKNILAVSDDFKIPDTPAPHWQVIDTKGNVYLLQQLKIKDNKFNRKIVVPSYIQDIAKVQIWCSFAEVVLGEAPFTSPVSLK